MKRKLYLDDLRPCPIGWDCVRSYQEFVDYITKHGMPDVISFDHDLGFEHYPFNPNDNLGADIPYDIYQEKTGYHCAKWLLENHGVPKQWNVHSMNPVGAENIRKLLSNFRERTKGNTAPPGVE